MNTLSSEMLQQLGTASQRLEDIADEMAIAKGKDAETYRVLKASYNEVAGEVAELKAKLASVRAPSKAHLIGSGGRSRDLDATDDNGDAMSFIKAVAMARSGDYQTQAEGKAWLEGRSRYQANEKASLGSTDATGGWIIPNDPVDDIVKPAVLSGPYTQLMTVIRGVNASGVDMPFRSAAPARAVVASWGSEKENVDLAYNGYTATMYTLARIHDISNQFLRKSAGAAEADVMGELSAAFARGVSYYLGQGGGSSEPYGLVTALNNAPATFTTSHSPDADTIPGSVARAIAVAASAIMGRGRKPSGVVLSPTGYSALLTDGLANAGFFIAGLQQNLGGSFAPGTLVSPWGLPVYVDPDFPTDDMVVADFSAFRAYIGQDFRVDTSSEANTRWDFNVTGFRGELELGFDARPAVYAGAAQYVADVIE